MGTERIRGRKLQRIRKLHLMEHPLCRSCDEQGRVRAATQVDHIVPLYLGGLEEDGNRQSLCDDCHADKTRQDMGYKDRTPCDASGMPLSSKHHWNR